MANIHPAIQAIPSAMEPMHPIIMGMVLPLGVLDIITILGIIIELMEATVIIMPDGVAIIDNDASH